MIKYTALTRANDLNKVGFIFYLTISLYIVKIGYRYNSVIGVNTQWGRNMLAMIMPGYVLRQKCVRGIALTQVVCIKKDGKFKLVKTRSSLSA
ncbi:hypothetical protein XBI1_2750002 [Xenorhabdus bovienii str. Intermedium]|uniref:Uncharacterized protein n=1 Tax=Xenorhabdus bovienii str. Intermedium TaxID=1379677 RepID=A0A077QKD5_XENBV|nr:hypothetical protein XBI1_2750002 [Xenorhabdus bovienii str. Intermedium]